MAICLPGDQNNIDTRSWNNPVCFKSVLDCFQFEMGRRTLESPLEHGNWGSRKTRKSQWVQTQPNNTTRFNVTSHSKYHYDQEWCGSDHELYLWSKSFSPSKGEATSSHDQIETNNCFQNSSIRSMGLNTGSPSLSLKTTRSTLLLEETLHCLAGVNSMRSSIVLKSDLAIQSLDPQWMIRASDDVVLSIAVVRWTAIFWLYPHQPRCQVPVKAFIAIAWHSPLGTNLAVNLSQYLRVLRDNASHVISDHASQPPVSLTVKDSPAGREPRHFFSGILHNEEFEIVIYLEKIVLWPFSPFPRIKWKRSHHDLKRP